MNKKKKANTTNAVNAHHLYANFVLISFALAAIGLVSLRVFYIDYRFPFSPEKKKKTIEMKTEIGIYEMRQKKTMHTIKISYSVSSYYL